MSLKSGQKSSFLILEPKAAVCTHGMAILGKVSVLSLVFLALIGHVIACSIVSCPHVPFLSLFHFVMISCSLLCYNQLSQWRRKQEGHGGRGPQSIYLGGPQYRSAPPLKSGMVTSVATPGDFSPNLVKSD